MITQKALRISLLVGIVILFISTYTLAAEINIYREGTYTNSKLALKIYADCNESNILSFGVKLSYNPTELSVVNAEKNEETWYFGTESEKIPYKDPDVSKEGEVDIIGGRLDTNNPLEGVSGERILIGKVLFNRNSTSLPDLSLSFLNIDNYVNFVTTDGTILDTKMDGVSFGEVTLQYDEPPTVSASPSGGTYDQPIIVTLSANEVASIHYTLDGIHQLLILLSTSHQ